MTAPGLGSSDSASCTLLALRTWANGEAPPRPRWGDYGAANEDNGTFWIASEEIHNNCNFSTWVATAGHCGGTQADRSPVPGVGQPRKLGGCSATGRSRSLALCPLAEEAVAL